MIKIHYVKLQMDAAKLETLLEQGWEVDFYVATKDFVVYHLKKGKK